MSSSILNNLNAITSNFLTEGELKTALHKAILDGNLNLAQQLSEQLLKGASTLDTWICNITDNTYGPLDMWAYMPGVLIFGKKPGEKYSVHKIIPHTDHMDLGEGRSLAVPIPSYDTAVDVCDKFNNHMGRGSTAGLFVIAGGRSTPTETELQEAADKLLKWDMSLIGEGDRYFDIGRRADISDLHRSACRRHNIKKAWLPEMQLAASCPACGSDIKAGIAKCPHCSAILDAERAKKFFPDMKNVDTAPAVPVEVAPAVFAADDELEEVQPISAETAGAPKLRARA